VCSSDLGKFLLTDNDFAITIYDIDTGAMETISTDDIRLVNIPIGNYVAGFYEVDGDYVVTRNDAGQVENGAIIKAIDIGNDEASVLSFSNPGDVSSGFQVSQVAVDAESLRVIAVANDTFYVYALNSPGSSPVEFDMSAMGGIGDEKVAFDNGIVLYSDDTVDDLVYYLDVTDPANTPVAITVPNNGGSRFVLRDGNYGFIYQGPASQGPTMAIGALPSTAPNISDGTTVFSNSTNGGRFGYGDTLAYGGGRWYIGGQDDIAASGDPFQTSATGNSWAVTADPRDPDNNLQLGDMTTNELGRLLVFKHEVDDDQFVGYMLLE